MLAKGSYQVFQLNQEGAGDTLTATAAAAEGINAYFEQWRKDQLQFLGDVTNLARDAYAGVNGEDSRWEQPEYVYSDTVTTDYWVVAGFLTWEGLCQPHQPHAFPSINEYGKHRNWTFANDCRNDNCFCYPTDRYQSWEGPDRTGKQICARRDYCQKTSDTTKTDGYIHTGCRHHEPDYCRNRIGCKCYDRWKRQSR